MSARKDELFQSKRSGPPSFDVTCVVGTVELDGGAQPPGVTAMMLIAEHDAPGTYRFPRADGTTQVVLIEYEGNT